MRNQRNIHCLSPVDSSSTSCAFANSIAILWMTMKDRFCLRISTDLHRMPWSVESDTCNNPPFFLLWLFYSCGWALTFAFHVIATTQQKIRCMKYSFQSISTFGHSVSLTLDEFGPVSIEIEIYGRKRDYGNFPRYRKTHFHFPHRLLTQAEWAKLPDHTEIRYSWF